MVNSVSGKIDSKDLGITLMHEHIASIDSSMNRAFPDWFNRKETISKAVKQLKQVKQYGLKTIVDATPINLGRDIHLLKEIAEKTQIQIIPSTGFYYTEEPFLSGWKIEHLVQLLFSEVENGIQGTDIMPGVIKCASKAEITETNEKLLRTAARLHVKSGLPVITHSSSIDKNGLVQQKILLEEEVNPDKLVIGHCGDTDDIPYLEALLEHECYIGLDRFGLDSILPMDRRIDVCVDLCERGYEKQIVVSHDYNVFIDWWPPDVLPYFRSSNPRWSFHHIFVDIIPKLIEKGVSQSQIDTMTIENPMKIFK